MGRTKPQQRPRPQEHRPQRRKPAGEQQLSQSAWAQIVKAIRELSRPAHA